MKSWTWRDTTLDHSEERDRTQGSCLPYPPRPPEDTDSDLQVLQEPGTVSFQTAGKVPRPLASPEGPEAKEQTPQVPETA